MTMIIAQAIRLKQLSIRAKKYREAVGMKKSKAFEVFLSLMIVLLLISLFVQEKKERTNLAQNQVFGQSTEKKQVLSRLGLEYYAVYDEQTRTCHFCKDLVFDPDPDGCIRYPVFCGQKISGSAFSGTAAKNIRNKVRTLCPECLEELKKDQSSKETRR